MPLFRSLHLWTIKFCVCFLLHELFLCIQIGKSRHLISGKSSSKSLCPKHPVLKQEKIVVACIYGYLSCFFFFSSLFLYVRRIQLVQRSMNQNTVSIHPKVELIVPLLNNYLILSIFYLLHFACIYTNCLFVCLFMLGWSLVFIHTRKALYPWAMFPGTKLLTLPW